MAFSMSSSNVSRSYEIIGASFGTASRHKGSRRAPAWLRDAGLLERLRRLGLSVQDRGDLVEPEGVHEEGDRSLRYLSSVLAYSDQIITALRKSYAGGQTPVLLGGDHSISIASVSAAVEHIRKTKGPEAELGLLWVDAHPDINTPETTETGNIHGMSVAHLLGRGEQQLVNLCGFAPKLRPENVVYIGLRDVDEPEKRVIRELGITAFSMKEVDLLGIGEVCRRAFGKLSQTAGYVLSYDLDVCDPVIAPGVGTPVRGGLSFRESHLIMELAAQSGGLVSLELVEYNPDIDNRGQTGEFAIGLIESALGKSIL